MLTPDEYYTHSLEILFNANIYELPVLLFISASKEIKLALKPKYIKITKRVLTACHLLFMVFLFFDYLILIDFYNYAGHIDPSWHQKPDDLEISFLIQLAIYMVFAALNYFILRKLDAYSQRNTSLPKDC